MALCDNIKCRRRELKLSQEYVAEQLGISRQAVAKWESGKSNPTAENLARLAALFEMNLSDLTADAQQDAESPRMQEKQQKEKQRNMKMHVGRAGAVLSINVGWDGYASGLYTAAPLYWLIILGAGLMLFFITSMDMHKKHKLERVQIAVGAVMIFSIFFLPQLIPIKQTGNCYLLADIVTAACMIFLNLKYWRYIWKTK